ncbi:MAG TPA: hypothetical protein VK081_00115 [Planctomycetota bacterium]|nr:hypothetical protein [Planctomycetota bacterium]
MNRALGIAAGTLAAAFVALTVVLLALRLHPACELDHNVGVYLTLAELAREGIVYPHAQRPDLIYATFYQPLGFLPYALLPGSGFTLIPAMRALVRLEVLAAVGLALLLLRRAAPGAWPAWAALVLLLCATPVTAALLTCTDDPRGAVFAALALLAFVGRDGRLHAARAAPLFALAFFTKLTAPCAAGVGALAAAGVRRARGGLALLAWCAAWTLLGYALAHGVLGWDLAGNGLRYALLEPRPGRTLPVQAGLFLRDVVRDPVTALLLVGGTAAAALRLLRRRADALDWWLLAALVRAFVEYRSHGTELNHLFEPCLAGAVAAVRTGAAVLRAPHVLVTLGLAIAFGRPLVRVPCGDPTPLPESPLASAAAILRAQPPAPTLCENPLLAWTSGTRPLVVDPFLFGPAVARHPEIRSAWFGDRSDPGALQRLVLLVDPSSASAEAWYRDLHFDARFLADVRRDFRLVAATPYGAVLERR